jgi:hypothetical protein
LNEWLERMLVGLRLPVSNLDDLKDLEDVFGAAQVAVMARRAELAANYNMGSAPWPTLAFSGQLSLFHVAIEAPIFLSAVGHERRGLEVVKVFAAVNLAWLRSTTAQT